MNEFQQIAKNIDQIKRYVGSIDTDPKKPDSSVVKNKAIKSLNDIVFQLAVLNRKVVSHRDKSKAKVDLCPKCKMLLVTKKNKQEEL